MAEYNITFKLPDGTEESVTCAEDQYILDAGEEAGVDLPYSCLLYTSPSPRDRTRSRMPSSA